MNAPAQRVTVVLERLSSVSDYDEEGYEDSWLVVAYLDLERGKRQRVTLHRCGSKAEAAAALEGFWGKMIAKRAKDEEAA